jgi:general secretion pathway protein K
MKRMGSKEGVALITSLLIIALLVPVVVEFNGLAVADIEISRNFGDEKKILFVTISGVNAVRELLRLDGAYSKSDTLLEGWAKSRPYFDSASSILDEGTLEGEIVDENGKICINSLIKEDGKFDPAQKALWEQLLRQPRFGLMEDQLNTIIHGVKDWIDADDELTGIYGAEDSFYQERGYRCKNQALNTLEEMLLINGVTKEIFHGTEEKAGIRPYLSVYGSGAININTAPIPVLMALSEDMTEEIAGEMDKFRQDEATVPLLEKKTWYKRMWPFEKPLPEEIMTTSSDSFTVRTRGKLGASIKEIETVILRTGESTQVIYWKEL